MTIPTMEWVEGEIDGCEIREIASFNDERGWLLECFRSDELAPALMPEMAYVSMTLPNVMRGPHEHVDQTDLFVFFDGTMRLFLWDAREDSPTFGRRFTVDLGADRKAAVVVPPGVVHGYRNVGDTPALIFNCPNRLYAGRGKRHPVDEIRHEDRDDSPFQID